MEHGLYGGFDAEGKLWMTKVYTGTANAIGIGAWVEGSQKLMGKGAFPSFLIHSHPSGNLFLSPGDRSQIAGKNLTVMAIDKKGGSVCQAPQ